MTLAVGWPGGVTPDVGGTLAEAQRFEFYGHQSPMWALAWSLPLALFDVPDAIALLFALQQVGYWFIFCLLGLASLRAGSITGATLAAGAGFLPPLVAFPISLDSNTQVGIAWGLALALAWIARSPRSIVAWLPFVFYGLICRYGTAISAAFILFACFQLTFPNRRPLALVWRTAATLGGFLLTSLLITRLLLGSPTRESLLISHLFDIVGVYEKTRTHCIPSVLVPDGSTAAAIMDEYDPHLVGSILWINSKGGFLLPSSHDESTQLRDCWLRTIRENPLAFASVKIRFAWLFLMFDTEWAPARYADYSENHRFGLGMPNPQLWARLVGYLDYSARMAIWKGWFWLLLTGGASIVALVLRVRHAAAALAIYIGAACTFVPHFLFGQAVLSRYFFLPYLLCVECLILIAVSLIEHRTRARGALGNPSVHVASASTRMAP